MEMRVIAEADIDFHRMRRTRKWRDGLPARTRERTDPICAAILIGEYWVFRFIAFL